MRSRSSSLPPPAPPPPCHPWDETLLGLMLGGDHPLRAHTATASFYLSRTGSTVLGGWWGCRRQAPGRRSGHTSPVRCGSSTPGTRRASSPGSCEGSRPWTGRCPTGRATWWTWGPLHRQKAALVKTQLLHSPRCPHRWHHPATQRHVYEGRLTQGTNVSSYALSFEKIKIEKLLQICFSPIGGITVEFYSFHSTFSFLFNKQALISQQMSPMCFIHAE